MSDQTELSDVYVHLTPADDGVVAMVGLELVGIGYLDPERDGLAAHIHHALRRHDEFLGAMEVADDGRWLELDYLGLPDVEEPWRSRVRIVLFAGTRGPNEDEARRRALGLYRAVMTSLPHDLGLYEFAPLQTAKQLAEVWTPFKPARRLEVARRVVRLDVEGEARSCVVPSGNQSALTDFGGLPRALLNGTDATRVRVAMRPTRLLPWEEDELLRLTCGGSRAAPRDPDALERVTGVTRLAAGLLRSRARLFLVRTWVETRGDNAAGTVAALVQDGGDREGGHWTLDGAMEVKTSLPGGAPDDLLLPGSEGPDGEDAAKEGRVRYLFTRAEAASIFRLPLLTEPLFGLPTRGVRLLLAPPAVATTGLRLGRNGRLASARPVAISDAARCRHMYVVGQTGTGKSTFLHNMIMQDVVAGRGVCVIDPHGDLVEGVLATVPEERMHEVALLDPTDMEHPVGINLLDTCSREEQDRIAEEFLALVCRLWPVEFAGPLFQYNIRNTLRLMMHLGEIEAVPGPPTILGLPRYIRDKKLIQKIQKHVQDPSLQEFVDDYLDTSDYHHSEMRGYLISKFNVLLGHVAAQLMVGQRRTLLNIKEVVEKGGILLVRLPSGELGEVAAKFLGFLVLLKIQAAILARVNLPQSQRKPFHLYVDEFQNFLTETLPILLAEGRKFSVRLVLANQYLDQLQDEKLRNKLKQALFGNVGTMVAFRVGSSDANELAAQYGPPVRPQDLVTLPNFEALARVLVPNGAPPTVSLCTEQWHQPPDPDRARRCRDGSRQRYGRPMEEARAEIQAESDQLRRIAKGL